MEERERVEGVGRQWREIVVIGEGEREWGKIKE